MNTLTANINIAKALAASEHPYARGKIISDDPNAPNGAGSPEGIDYVILPDRSVQCSVGWSPHVQDGVITHFYQDDNQVEGILYDVPELNHHPTVLTNLPDGSPVRVDRDIAHILKALWAQGVETFASCQGGCPGDGRPANLAMIGYYTCDENTVREFFKDFPYAEFEDGGFNTRFVWFQTPLPCPACTP
jgi:hypothetical protein